MIRETENEEEKLIIRVILASQGFTTDEIENEVSLIVGKEAKFLKYTLNIGGIIN